MLNDTALDACARYVLDQAKHVIESFGPRPPGSEGEGLAQEHVRTELQGCCDGEVKIEPFHVAQKAFMGQQRLCGILAILATVGYWLSPWLAVALSGSAMLVLYFELIRYYLFIDKFFPLHTSYNVWGVQKPAGEVKRRIVLNGHPDAAYEWRFLYNYPKVFPAFVLYSILGMVLKFVTDFACLLFNGGDAPGQSTLWTIVGLLQLLLAPGAVIGIFFNDFKNVSHGANDNLTGTFMATGIAKHLRESGVQLQNTELVVAITGSEEAGLRGAKVFANDHKAEMADVETIVVALDTFRDLDHMTIYSRDLNGTVAHDPGVCKLLKDAGADCGRDLPYGSIFLGSSDGTAFTQAGWRAAAFAAMDPAPADYYHNRRDNWDNMDEACVRASIAVVLAAIKRYDDAPETYAKEA